MRRQLAFLFALVGALLLTATLSYGQRPRAEITFDNQSGDAALVKLIGPTPRTVPVANQQRRTVTVTGGRYYILVRYGPDREGNYRYTKGDPFDVTQTRRHYSIISITLHTVVNGNYHAGPSDQKEFDGAN
jgi:hypothetical protein